MSTQANENFPPTLSHQESKEYKWMIRVIHMQYVPKWVERYVFPLKSLKGMPGQERKKRAPGTVTFEVCGRKGGMTKAGGPQSQQIWKKCSVKIQPKLFAACHTHLSSELCISMHFISTADLHFATGLHSNWKAGQGGWQFKVLPY